MKHQHSTRLFAGLLAVGLSIGSALAKTPVTNTEFEGISVRVEGQGPDLVFIPGLNSGAGTFTDTCAAFKTEYRCHLLHLPGFAGNAPIADVQNGFLPEMRERVSRYIESQKLHKPVLVGHSLGGVLSLMIALEKPELAKALVIVDSLPFYATIQNPVATAESMKPVAEQMRAGMMQQSEDDYRSNSKRFLQGMSNQPERMQTLIEWGNGSDRATTTQAMVELMTTDLRLPIAQIKTPTMVLGAWAAYKAYGSTKESTRAIYAAQYQQLPNVDIRMSDTAYHFISWDDPQWLQTQIRDFLSQH